MPSVTLENLDYTADLARLEISKFATPKVEKEFIHFDKLPDGTWRMLFNVKDANGKQLETSMIDVLRINR